MQTKMIGSVPVDCVTGLAGGVPTRVTFRGETADFRWPLRDLDGEFPTDWSPYQYLVL